MRGVAFLLLLVPLCAGAEEPAVQRLVGRALGDTPLMADLRELCDGIGGRPTGSPANERSVEWAVAKLKAAGLDVHTEAVRVPYAWLGDSASGAVLAPERFPLAVVAAPFSGSARGREAKLLVAGADLSMPAGARGAFVLVPTPPMNNLGDLFAEYMRNQPLVNAATAAGVAGLLVESSHPRGLLYRHPITFGEATRYPVVLVSREQAARLRGLSAAGEVRLRLDVANRTGGAYQARNVIAELRGREKPDEIVVLGAHLDSWDLGTGANDNGVNAALVIDVARGLKALGLTPRRTVRFALWNGEEQGMYGSAGYVLAHAAELDRHVMTITFDIGSGRTLGFFVSGRDELRASVDEALRPVAGLGPFTQLPDGIDGTDNFDFLLSGVPNLVANQDATPYLPDYHASSDTVDKVDAREAQNNAAIAAALVWSYAERPERPAGRQTRAEVDALLEKTGLVEQMKGFGQWDAWKAGTRGVSR